VFYNLRQTVNRAWFGFWAGEILKTPALDIRGEGLVIFSLISHRDVMMYLAAIKSFYNRLRRGRIMILNDGSLTFSDMALLKAHVRPSAIIHIADVRTAPCPKGSCWERLLCIADLVCDSYVIQLDADSLALGSMPEVEAHIVGQKSFAIGQEYLGQEIYPMAYVCSEMKKKDSEYVEVVAERNFDRLEGFENLKYSRSNACFTGFARGSFSRQTVEDFSIKMEAIVGKRWHEWGTEKVTSNYIIANSRNSAILPYPKYVSYYDDPRIDYEKCSYLHFTGTHRFKNGFYIQSARKAIKEIKEGEGDNGRVKKVLKMPSAANVS